MQVNTNAVIQPHPKEVDLTKEEASYEILEPEVKLEAGIAEALAALAETPREKAVPNTPVKPPPIRRQCATPSAPPPPMCMFSPRCPEPDMRPDLDLGALAWLLAGTFLVGALTGILGVHTVSKSATAACTG